MRVLRWHGQKDIRVEEVPEPQVGPGQVKVKVKWCGICGTDIHEYEAGPLLVKVTKPHPLPGSKMAPVIMGHELSGDVTEVGEGVTNINVGDRVVVRPTIPCYNCYYCKRSQYVQCTSLGTIGYIWDGGFAEYMVAPSDTIYKIPDSLSYEVASFVEPLACAVHAVRRAKLFPGATVAVIGTGPIGLLTIEAARTMGAGKVFALETLPARYQVAQKLGVEAVINPLEVDAGKEMAKLTDGLRADFVFECAGPPAAMLSALKVSGRGGTIVEVGQMVEPCQFPFGTLWMHEKTIITSQGYTDEFPAAIAFLADGRVSVAPLITAKIGLDDVIKQGFEALTGEERYNHIKILVSPEL